MQHAKEAVKVIRDSSRGWYFFDIEMPHLNGFELLEMLAPVQFHVILPRVMINMPKSHPLQRLDYLLKPVDMDELKTAVKKVEERLAPSLPLQWTSCSPNCTSPSPPSTASPCPLWTACR